MPEDYHIQSVNTKYCLISHDEVDGEIVKTENGASSIPEHSILTISPPIKGPISTVTVRGVQGLYVALPKDHSVGSKLIWSKEAYLWDVIFTPTDDKPTHQFIPHSGEDLFWFDKFGIGQVIIVENGANTKPPQPYFDIIVA